MPNGAREIKVGLFVFIALILLAVVVFSISDFYTAQPQYTLRVRFHFANGIEVGAPVRLAGVTVGEVRAVRVIRDEATQRSQAELGITLSRDAKIEENAVAYINTLGLIGEKYLEVVSGTPGARALGPGDVLVGKDSIPAEQLLETGYREAKQLEQAVTSLNVVLSDEENRTAIRQTLANSAQASERLSLFLEQANFVMNRLREGQGTVGLLLTEDDLYRDLKDITADVKAHPWKLFYRPKESGRGK